MYWLAPILAIVGVVALLYGFTKNNRNILLVAAIVLFFAGTAGDLLSGFKAGVQSHMPEPARSAG
jgi:membrane-bound ClpP family serine protease